MRFVYWVILLLGAACSSVSVPWSGDPGMRLPVAEASPRGRLSPPAQEGTTSGVESTGQQGEEVEPPHSLVLFLGATYKDEADASYALSYLRRISPFVALGMTIEDTPSVREAVLIFPSVVLYPLQELYLSFSPGLELEQEGTRKLFRVGVGWDFELGGDWTLAPEINYDFVEHSEDAVVTGLALAWHF